MTARFPRNLSVIEKLVQRANREDAVKLEHDLPIVKEGIHSFKSFKGMDRIGKGFSSCYVFSA